jgi:signal transduction histidine kinase/ActR/RegA family two-component response regulator
MREPVEKILVPESIEKVVAYLQAVREAQQSNETLPGFRADLTYYCKDGSLLWTEVIAHPVPRMDGRVEILGVTRDISERKKAEKLIQENQARLAAAERAAMVGELAGGIAHNFNNLLMIINGYGEMLAKTSPNDPGYSKYIASILDAGTRAASLTKQLLAFGRRQELVPQEIELKSFVAEFAPVLRSICDGNITWTISEDNQAGVVRIDQNQLKEAVMNLALNARDAMPAGGNLNIRTGQVYLDKTSARLKHDCPPGRYVYLSMTDSGEPIPADKLARIFEPFFAKNHLHRSADLGLASAEGVIGQSGGFVEATSSTATGNTFTIFLPWIRSGLAEKEAAVPPRAFAAATGKGACILLVDDETDVRKITARLLARLGHRIIEAESGERALAMTRADPLAIDILVTDVIMPGLSGQQLAARLREARPELPVLFISGYSPQELFPEGMPAAGMGFLAKPFTFAMLAGQMQKLLNKANIAQPA